MNKKYLLAVVASTLMFAACGDDVTEVNEIHQDGMAVLEAGEKLSKQACDTTNVGEMLFVIDSSAAFVCDGKSWQTLKGEKGGKGDPGKDGVDGADGKDGVDGKDGADGVDGKDGEKGEKGAKGDKGDTGASCSVARNTANDGVTVTCGESSVDIKDGAKGDKGDKGDAGASCSVARNTANDGVTVTCGETSVDIKDGAKGDKGDAGASCSVARNTANDGVTVTCGETSVDIKDGVKGDKGDKGDAGANCSVARNTANDGVTVTCGETSVDIKDGAKGDKGDKGDAGANCSVARNTANDGVTMTCGETSVEIKDGVGCTLDDEGDGTVKVTCGEGDNETITNIYKAVCGAKPYDPAKSFCSDDELFSCDDKPYDPKKQFCKQGSTVEDYGWLTDTRDRQIYKTVKIGDQTWMAENLNYSVKPNVQSWCGGGIGVTEGDCSVYGRLYTWAAAVGKSEDECGYGKTCNLPSGDIRGVCPEGWHLPSDVEWNALFTAVGGTSYAGQKLKADSDLWYEGTSNDDSFGFAVLPAGLRYHYGIFDFGIDAYFWSPTEINSYNAYIWDFYYLSDKVLDGGDLKEQGLSVRCLRD